MVAQGARLAFVQLVASPVGERLGDTMLAFCSGDACLLGFSEAGKEGLRQRKESNPQLVFHLCAPF